MKTRYVLPLFVLLLSCSKKEAEEKKKEKQVSSNTEKKTVQTFQTIIDSAGVQGSILIYDLEEDQYLSNDFDWAEIGRLPASTFKITNSIIALEVGVVKNDSTLFKWNGEKRLLKLWEQDLILRDAFHFSCVPCYQEIATKIGVDRMTKHLRKLKYGHMKVHSGNIDMFWLDGDSRISQFQQIDFLKRFYLSQLPISERTHLIMKDMMVVDENERYTLSGKTGWSTRNGNNNGWFVGYLESRDKTYFFATNVNPKEEFDMVLFPEVRKRVTYDAFKHLGIIE